MHQRDWAFRRLPGGLALHSSTGAPHERFHFGEGRRRRVAGRGHRERAVGGADLDGSLQVVALEKSKDEAGGEAIAATDAIENFQPRRVAWPGRSRWRATRRSPTSR